MTAARCSTARVAFSAWSLPKPDGAYLLPINYAYRASASGPAPPARSESLGSGRQPLAEAETAERLRIGPPALSGASSPHVVRPAFRKAARAARRTSARDPAATASRLARVKNAVADPRPKGPPHS